MMALSISIQIGFKHEIYQKAHFTWSGSDQRLAVNKPENQNLYRNCCDRCGSWDV